jgi:hypothetical protein
MRQRGFVDRSRYNVDQQHTSSRALLDFLVACLSVHFKDAYISTQ